MLDLLVYLLDEQYKEEIFNTFNSKMYFCRINSKEEEVVDACRKDLVDLLLVWPASYPILSKLIGVLNGHDLKFIPIIAVVHRNDDIAYLSDLPITDVIQIPTSKEEFFIIIDGVVKKLREESIIVQGKFLKGTLKEMPLVDVLHRIEMGAKDAMMTVMERGHIGQIYFKNGKMIRSAFRSLKGLDALKKMCALDNAEFQIHFTSVDSQDEFGIENKEIIQEINRQVIDQKTFLKKLPDIFTDLKTVNMPLKNLQDADMKTVILEFCRQGESIYDLLLVMNQDNLKILEVVEELLQEGLLLLPTADEQVGERKSLKRGFTQIFDNFGNIFKKDKIDTRQEGIGVDQGQEAQNEGVQIVRQKHPIDHTSHEKIENFIEIL